MRYAPHLVIVLLISAALAPQVAYASGDPPGGDTDFDALTAGPAVANPSHRSPAQTIAQRRRAAKVAYWSRVFGWNVARWYGPVHAYFPGHEREAFYVIGGESGGNPRASNGVCYGLFQLHRCHALNFRRLTGRPFFWYVYRPWPNIRYAAYMSRGGRDWSAWSVRP